MKHLLLYILIIASTFQSFGQDVLGDQDIEGTLRIECFSTTRMGVYRYTNGSWVQQWFSGDNKGFKLFISSMGSDDDINLADGYFYTSGSSWDSKVLNKIDDNNHITTCTENDVVEVKQIVYYPANSANVVYQYEITNLGTSSIIGARFFMGGDTYLAGYDNGIG